MKNKNNINDTVTINQLVNLITELHGYAHAVGVLTSMIDGHITYGHNGVESFEKVYDLQSQIDANYKQYSNEQFKKMVGLTA